MTDLEQMLFALMATGLIFLQLACSTANQEPLPTVETLDLDRFMGEWYVIANIPTRFERGAHNAVESYRLDGRGRVATTFTFNDGAFDGPEKRFEPLGFVRENSGNAIWGMQFVWPIKAEYRVMYVDSEYHTTIVGRSKRDFVWIMAREPELPGEQLERLISLVVDAGYERDAIELVPQKWN
jgi:apolipoprotein D and lipocalin family protein